MVVQSSDCSDCSSCLGQSAVFGLKLNPHDVDFVRLIVSQSGKQDESC